MSAENSELLNRIIWQLQFCNNMKYISLVTVLFLYFNWNFCFQVEIVSSEKNTSENEIPLSQCRNAERKVDYVESTLSESDLEDCDFTTDDEYVPPSPKKKPKIERSNRKLRGHQHHQGSSSTLTISNLDVKRDGGRGRSRGRGIRRMGISRAEFLSQHEQIVEELCEEDIERGLTLNTPCKTIRKKIPSILTNGNSRY